MDDNATRATVAGVVRVGLDLAAIEHRCAEAARSVDGVGGLMYTTAPEMRALLAALAAASRYAPIRVEADAGRCWGARAGESAAASAPGRSGTDQRPRRAAVASTG